MRNIYFYETREEAKAKAKELKKKGNRVVMSKESTPYKADDGRLLYYSVMWIFWYIKTEFTQREERNLSTHSKDDRWKREG